MKNLTHTKRMLADQKGKVITIKEHSEDHECVTFVRKHFIYMARPVVEAAEGNYKPQVRVRKAFNSKTHVETFSLRVKGFINVKQDDQIFKVEFLHSLNINIQWKKIFSPKKSATIA